MKKFLIIFVCLCCFYFPKIHGEDSIPNANKKHFLYFPFVEHSVETKWGFGAAGVVFFKTSKIDSSIRTSDISVLGLYTLNKQVLTALNATVFFKHENQILRFQSSYSYYPDKFWGIGNETKYSIGEHYSQTQYFFNPQLLQRLRNKLYVGLSYEFQHSGKASFEPGGLFDQQNIKGRYGANTSGLGALVTWDTRNSAYSPTAGSFVEMSYSLYGKLLGSDYSLNVFNLDLRKYFYIDKKSVLALQSLIGLSNGDVPFRKLQQIGGTDMMRGYYAGRFRDNCVQAYQAEYRRFLFWKLGIVAFAACGEVAPNLNKFNFNDFHYSYGGGLRLMLDKKEKLNLRLDYGFGKKSSGFTVQIREAF